FEVAGRIDLDEVPGFGRDAPLPDQDALATVGTDQCMPMVDGYTGGRQVDPEGRFTGLVVPPSAEGWAKGDHAVLCGIAPPGLVGSSAPCPDVRPSAVASALEVSGPLPDEPRPPAPEAQPALTAAACHEAGATSLGGAEALRQSTLISTLVPHLYRV